jgi:hypothetical protein
MEAGSTWVAAWALNNGSLGEMRVTNKGDEVSLGDNENVLNRAGYTTLLEAIILPNLKGQMAKYMSHISKTL